MQAIFPSFHQFLSPLKFILIPTATQDRKLLFGISFNLLSGVEWGKPSILISGIFVSFPVVVFRPCSSLRWAVPLPADNVWKQDCNHVREQYGEPHQILWAISGSYQGRALASHTSHCRCIVHFSRASGSAVLNDFSNHSRQVLLFEARYHHP